MINTFSAIQICDILKVIGLHFGNEKDMDDTIGFYFLSDLMDLSVDRRFYGTSEHQQLKSFIDIDYQASRQ